MNVRCTQALLTHLLHYVRCLPYVPSLSPLATTSLFSASIAGKVYRETAHQTERRKPLSPILEQCSKSGLQKLRQENTQIHLRESAGSDENISHTHRGECCNYNCSWGDLQLSFLS
ncbi:hypothetical protein M758_UG147400 [Ceratodon purpureus]|nr:hypothetical protein M758_UG147400 [Ceratodon purpureus]